jgi:CDP-diacylglycerol--serine O-phosphatidyltransferase
MAEAPTGRRLANPELRRRRLFGVLPSLLTLGNGACGFGAITFAAKVGPDTTMENTLYIAALLIFAAMVFDARWPARAAFQTDERLRRPARQLVRRD